MFGKIFRRKQKEKKAEQLEPQLAPETEALINAIRKQSKADPLVGAKLGSKEVFQRLLSGMKDSKGVHVESLLAALGALAGYACQANLRAQAIAKGMPETAPFQVIGTKNGKQSSLKNSLSDQRQVH